VLLVAASKEGDEDKDKDKESGFSWQVLHGIEFDKELN